MAKAKLEIIREVVREDVTLTMTKNEAQRVMSILAKVRATDGVTGVYSALRDALGHKSTFDPQPYSVSGGLIRLSK